MKFPKQKKTSLEINIQRVLGRCETFELRSVIFVAFAARSASLFFLAY